MIQLSHPYVTTRKIIALTGWTFVSKVMSLPFNVPSGLSQPFFQGASVFNFMAAVIVLGDSGAQENKNCHCFHCFPVYLPWSDGTRSHDLSFFECLVLSKLFHSPLSPSSSGPSSLLLPLGCCHGSPHMNTGCLAFFLSLVMSPETGEPGGLLSLGSHRVGHDWSNLAAAAMYWIGRQSQNKLCCIRMSTKLLSKLKDTEGWTS